MEFYFSPSPCGDLGLFAKFSEANCSTWLGGSIESVNHLWTANIYSPHISNGYIASYSIHITNY